MEGRERHAEGASIARLMAPRSIAVIGAGRRAGTIGHELFRNLLAFGFEGPVYPVNPSSVSVAGVHAYPTLLDIPDAVDLAVIVVPASEVLAVVRQCAEKRVHGLVIITAGFAEAGAGGQDVEREVVAIARAQRHAGDRPELSRRREHCARRAHERVRSRRRRPTPATSRSSRSRAGSASS